MVGKKIAMMMAASVMMAQAASASAAEIGSTGLASNRMALALPVSPQEGGACAPTPAGGTPANCVIDNTVAAGTGRSLTLPLLLGGVAAAGVGIAAATGGGHHHGGGGGGGGGTPVSP